MLPRLAATVSSTTAGISQALRVSGVNFRKQRMVSGTRVMRLTSLVISMLKKKETSTSAVTMPAALRLPAVRRPASTVKKPVRRMPAEMVMRPKSSPSVLKSI